MMGDNQEQAGVDNSLPQVQDAARKDLPPAAQRALAEAEERRRKAKATEQRKVVSGSDGPDPARYGDWEKGGIAKDF